ncbi:MAG: 3-dehydroquinate synthase, partial [Bacteroidota bacterium]
MNHTIEQRFSIPYEYNIYFTQDLFASSNHLLLDIIKAQGKRLPAKIAVVIDSGVNDHHPTLISEIEAFAKEHASSIVLCGKPLVVTGGETTKNTLDDVQKVLELINDGKVDRHAFIIAIGGGAVLDMAGFAAA